jgi:hypothetical protein
VIQRSALRCVLFLLGSLAAWTAIVSADEAVPAACCPDGCGKICVRVPDVLKTPRTIYDCKCEDYCAPRCSLRALLGGLCGCGDTCCGPVRTRKILLKKVVTDECPTTKCVVQQVPCEGACAAPN